MKKVFLVGGVLVSAFLLTGCIKMDIDHTIQDNGASSVKTSIDMTAFNAIMKGMRTSLSGSLAGTGTTSSSTETSSSEPCKSSSGATNNMYLQNYSCTAIDANRAIINGTSDLSAMNGFIAKNNVFVYDLKKIEKIINGEKASGKSSSTSSSSGTGADPKSYGLEYTYRVTMPGEILSTDIGAVSGSVVTIDFFALDKLSRAYVVAKAPGTNPTDADVADALATMKSFAPVGSVVLAPAQEAAVQKFVQNAEKKWALAKSKLLDQLIAIQGKIGKEKSEIYNRLVYLLKNGGQSAMNVIKNTKKNVPKMRQSVEDLRNADRARERMLTKLLREIESYHAFKGKGKYPDSLDQLNGDFFKVPQDPKQGKVINGCEFWYTYTLEKSREGRIVPAVSNCMESAEMQEEAANDHWVDPLRYERWEDWVYLSK